MTDPSTTSVAEQAPAAVQWAINLHSVRMQRKAKIEADAEEINRKLAALKAQADQLVAQRDQLVEEWTAVELDGQIALEMAHAACRTHGWAVPEPEGEPPLNETGAFPVTPPMSDWERSMCLNCGTFISRAGQQAEWLHNFTNHPHCLDTGDLATPTVIEAWWPHKVRWHGVAEAYVCAEPTGPGLDDICGIPATTGVCPKHSGADLGQVTATAAEATRPDEAGA